MQQSIQLQLKSTLISPIKSSIKLTPQINQKINDIIRKKASLYGLPQLSNPLNYKTNDRQSILIPKNNQINIYNQQQRSFSSLSKNTIPTQNKSTLINIQKPTSHSTLTPSFQLTLAAKQSSQHKQRLFPKISSFKDLILQQREIIHVFKDKLEYDINDIVFQYLKMISLSIDYQDKVFGQNINPQKCMIINTLETVTESFLELGFKKVALFFAATAVDICEFYKIYDKVGRFLLMIAKVLRKVLKYEDSVLVLKKSLEYVWLERRITHQNHQNISVNHHNNHNQINTHLSIQINKNNHLNTKQLKDNKKPSHKIKRNEAKPHHKSYSTEKTIPHQPIEEQNHLTSLGYLQHNNSSIHHKYEPFQSIKTESSNDYELQIYNQLSYCLLQLNKKEESQIFGQKYEIGYVEKQGTNVMSLSKQLINSAQKRITKWQRVHKSRLDMIIGVELDEYLIKNEMQIKGKFNETKFLNDLKFNFDLFMDNFLKKEMFFYQIPMPLEFKKQILRELGKNPNKLPKLGHRFVMKKRLVPDYRSNSMNVKSMKRNENIEEKKILIYRQIGFCRTKLINLFKNYIKFVKYHLQRFNSHEIQQHYQQNNKIKIVQNYHNHNHKDNQNQYHQIKSKRNQNQNQ